LAIRYHPDGHVPLSWFLATSVVCSACCHSSVLQPDAGYRVRCVSVARTGNRTAQYPRIAFTPLRIPLANSRSTSLRSCAFLLFPPTPRFLTKTRGSASEPHNAASSTASTVRPCRSSAFRLICDHTSCRDTTYRRHANVSASSPFPKCRSTQELVRTSSRHGASLAT
jgi:hypothetical protein